MRYDLAYGGNFYAITELAELGIPFERDAKDELLRAGLAVMAAIDEQDRPVHPERPDLRGCRHVFLNAPGSTPLHSRHAMAIHPGWFDRSPCGTGTSARLAQLHARGCWTSAPRWSTSRSSAPCSRARILETATVAGIPAVVPSVTGRAWITGIAQYLLDPSDPFPAGFLV